MITNHQPRLPWNTYLDLPWQLGFGIRLTVSGKWVNNRANITEFVVKLYNVLSSNLLVLYRVRQVLLMGGCSEGWPSGRYTRLNAKDKFYRQVQHPHFNVVFWTCSSLLCPVMKWLHVVGKCPRPQQVPIHILQ